MLKKHFRLTVFVVSFINIIVFVLVSSWLSTQGTEVAVVLVDGKSKQARPIETEFAPIVNEDAIRRMSRDFTSVLFNVNPGLYEGQLKNKKIENAFISPRHYKNFAEQYSKWLSIEFSVNNVSVKESVVFDDEIVMSGEQVDGVRLWRYTANVPVLDRALGQNEQRNMKLVYDIAYIPSIGRLGIYAVNIY